MNLSDAYANYLVPLEIGRSLFPAIYSILIP